MLRRGLVSLQLPQRPYVGGIGYAAAFAAPSERDAAAHQRATALYSPAPSAVRRRRGHLTRQKAYAAKRQLLGAMARDELGMSK